MFDAHTHIHDSRLMPFFSQMVEAAAVAGIKGLCSCGTAPDDWAAVAALTTRSLPFHVVPAFGVHPWYVTALPDDWCERLEEILHCYPAAAIGEIGLDGIRQEVPVALQEEVFTHQLELAMRLERPVVLHGARAWEQLLMRIRPYAPRLKGFMAHGFGGSAEQLTVLLALGGYVSIGGTICHSRATRSRAVVSRVPESQLLIETDTPDLFPENGKAIGVDAQNKPLNQPANLTRVLRETARLRQMPIEYVAQMTAENGARFFGRGICLTHDVVQQFEKESFGCI